MSYKDLLRDVQESADGPGTAAFFDFDGTLIDGYSAMAFYQHRLKNGDVGPSELASLVLTSMRGSMTGEEFVELAERGLRSWAGRPIDELEELGLRLFTKGIAGSIFPEAWALVRAHQAKGHTVVIASSATRFQLQPLADELEIKDVLCTEVEVEGDLVTGKLDGPVRWGDGKAQAVVAFAADRGLDLGDCFGYANGSEDVPFLAAVGRPYAVNPQKDLAVEAERLSWPVLSFGSRPTAHPVDVVRTVASYAGMAGAFATSLGLGLLNQNRRKAVDLGFSLSGDISLALAGIHLNIAGEEHLWAHRPAVFIFNHQSNLDGLIMGSLLRRDFAGVAKKEAASMPGFGQFLKLADTAFVERGNTEQARAALAPALERLKGGLSLALSPEGTRSMTARVGPFKKGAFHIAMEAGVPIVPIAIRNAGELWWRGSNTMRSGTVDIQVMPPISVADWQTKDLTTHIAGVRQQFVDVLANWPHA